VPGTCTKAPTFTPTLSPITVPRGFYAKAKDFESLELTSSQDRLEQMHVEKNVLNVFHPLTESDEIVAVEYKERRPRENIKGGVIFASLTTAAGRIKLIDASDKVPIGNLVYFDTVNAVSCPPRHSCSMSALQDSLMVLQERSCTRDPLADEYGDSIGATLYALSFAPHNQSPTGDLTDEIRATAAEYKRTHKNADVHVSQFQALGPKTYMYLIVDRTTGDIVKKVCRDERVVGDLHMREDISGGEDERCDDVLTKRDVRRDGRIEQSGPRRKGSACCEASAIQTDDARHENKHWQDHETSENDQLVPPSTWESHHGAIWQ